MPPHVGFILFSLRGNWGKERDTQAWRGRKLLSSGFQVWLGQAFGKEQQFASREGPTAPSGGGSLAGAGGIRSSFVGRESDVLYKSTLCQLAWRAGWGACGRELGERAQDPKHTKPVGPGARQERDSIFKTRQNTHLRNNSWCRQGRCWLSKGPPR